MTITWIDLLVIALYFLGLVAFGVIVRRIRTFGDYAVGGRAVPGSMIFASLAATYIGPGYTLGFCSKGFTSGFLFFFVSMAFTAQTLLVGLFLAPRLHRFRDSYTVGDVMGRIYGKAAHLLAGLISFVLCVGFVAVMAKVGGLVLTGTLGMRTELGIALVTGVGVLYSYTGGIKSVIATDALQFTIFAIVVPVLLLVATTGSPEGISALGSEGWLRMRETATGMGPIALLGLFASFFLGETLVPPYANRALAAKSGDVARTGFVTAAGYSVLWGGMVVGLGIIAHGAVAPENPDDVFMAVATKYLPHGMIGLVIMAIAAVIMSSQESVLNAGAVSFTKDIWGEIRGKAQQTDEGNLWLSRIATLGVGVFATIVAMFSPSIIDGLLIIYSLWAPSVLPPLVLGLLLKRPPWIAGVASMLTGIALSVTWQFGLHEPGNVPALLVGLAGNLIAYGLCILLVPRVREATVIEAPPQLMDIH